MFDLIALVGAIALIVVVLMLRAAASLPFARLQGRFVPGVAPSGSELLFEEASTQLAALGFGAPRWFLSTRVDGEPQTLPLRAVLVAPDGGLATLMPPASPAQPHRLLVFYSHRLQDGRVAITQPFDPFYAGTQTDEIVARTTGELTYAAQWASHQTWVGSLGSAARPMDEGDILDQMLGVSERQRQALLTRGVLRAVNENLAVPTLRFALRLLLKYFTRPKPPIDPRPVPCERLAMFARLTEQTRQRAPLRRTQWTLFALSVVLFMALGAVLWDVAAALGILVVVLIHELGHFLAMRAFGYRNVHLLALPLVGGVAMGVDAKPAATRRAWMSLMGPLPGIVIGWGLLALWFVGGATSGELFSLALLFLLINYLNVLPVPPLDGAHVVQSLLPPRWGQVQTVFIGVAAAVGAWFAWQFGFVLLALLAALHLLGLPAAWRLRGVERDLAADPTFAGEHRSSRLLRILRRIERALGPAKNAQQRVNQALEVITRLETQPMGGTARLATGTVYASLLVVPLAALVLFYAAWQPETAQAEQRIVESQQRREQWQSRAEKLPMPELLAGVSTAELPLASPVDAAAIAAAEARLGSTLPDELRALYGISDGVPSQGVAKLDAIVLADKIIDAELAPYSDSLAIELGSTQSKWVEIPFKDARTWWYLGGNEEAPLFYLPEPDPRLPGKRVVSYFLEAPSSHASLRKWLEEVWIGEQESREYVQEIARRIEQVRTQWQDASIETVLSVYQPASLIEHLVMPDASPAGADAASLAAAESRLGVTLPQDYADLLRAHDGFPALQLLPSGELTYWRDGAARISDEHRRRLFDPAPGFGIESVGGEALPTLTEDAVIDCVLVASLAYDKDKNGLLPTLIWCPGGPLPWKDLFARRGYAQFRSWLIDKAAPVAAYRDVDLEE